MTHWSKFPFFRFLIPFIFGIILCYEFDHPFVIPYYTIVCLLIIIALWQWRKKSVEFFRYRSIFGLLLNLTILLVGYKLMEETYQLKETDHFSNFNATTQLFEAKVIQQPSVRSKYIKTVIEIESVITDTLKQKCLGRVVCYFSKDITGKMPEYGDVIIFGKQPERIEKPGNPGEFDYRRFLEHKRIYHSIYLRSSDYKIISSGNGEFLKRIAYKSRSALLNILKNKGLDENEYAVAAAILTGYDDLLDDDLRRKYTDAGVIHILCVSGLHVGVIYLMAEFIFSFIYFIKKSRFIKPVLIIMLIWCYALLTGLAAPVLRAAFMFSMIMIGHSLRRQNSNINILCAAAFILLLIDPRSLFNIGFQLSFAAVAGIMIFKPYFNTILIPRNPFISKLWELISISLSAQLLVTPFVLFYFHKFPIYFLLANVLAVPLSGIVIYTGVATFFTSFIPYFDKFSFIILKYELKLLNGTIDLLDRIPGSVIANIHVSLFFAITLMAGIIIFSMFIATAKKKYLWLGLICIIAMSTAAAMHKVEIQAQEFIVFHKYPGHTLISFINSTEQSILADSLIGNDIQKASYQLEGLVVKSGIRNQRISTIPFKKSAFVEIPWFYSFKGKRVTILHGNCILPKNPVKMLKTDFVLLCNNPDIPIEIIRQCFPDACIIADNSCKPWYIKKLEEDSKKFRIVFYNLKEQGALVVKLSA